MYTNFEYNRYHAQTKMRDFQQQAAVERQFKRPSAPKTQPNSQSWVQQRLLALKAKLRRPAYA